METRVEYKDDGEKNGWMHVYNHLYLIGEELLGSGNFLIFSDKPLTSPDVIYVNIPIGKIDELGEMQKANTQAILDMMDIMLFS